jgi:simple sugar transport system substrate-binding protein/ribose transport system substrate-binding protein
MRCVALVCAVIVTALGAGCQEQPKPAAPPAQKTFVVITDVDSSDVERGANAAKDVHTTVRVVRAGEAQAQVAELDRLATGRGVDGVAIDCVAVPEVSQAIARCVQAGIPVVTYNSDCPGAARRPLETPAQMTQDPGRHSFIGTDLADLGRIMAYQCLRGMGDAKGVVAVVSGPEHPNLKRIEDAIKEYLRGMAGVTLMDPVRPAVEPAAVTRAVEEVLRQEPNVRGWILINPAAVPDAAAAPIAKIADAFVVMLGLGEAALPAVGPEKVDVLVFVPFTEYGAAAVKVLAGITRDHEYYPNVIQLGPKIVTIDNLEAVTNLLKQEAAGDVPVAVIPSGGGKPNQPSAEKPPAEKPAETAPTEKPVEGAAPAEKPAETAPPEKPAEGAAPAEKPAETAPTEKPAEGAAPAEKPAQ